MKPTVSQPKSKSRTLLKTGILLHLRSKVFKLPPPHVKVDKVTPKKTVTWVFITLGIIALVTFGGLFFYYLLHSPSEDINVVNSLIAGYIGNNALYSQEAALTDVSKISTSADIPRAVDGSSRAQMHLANMKGNATDIVSMSSDIKGEYSGAEKEWLELVESCYAGRLKMIAEYEKEFPNLDKYLNYYNYELQYSKHSDEFSALLSTWIYNNQAGNKQEAIDAVNKMKAKLSELKNDAQSEYNAIPFSFPQKRIVWTEKYSEGLDILLQFYATSNRQYDEQATKKIEEAAKALEGVTSSGIDEEVNTWFTNNVDIHTIAGNREATNADNVCTSASAKYEEAFPN